jgi:hypothetical protein
LYASTAITFPDSSDIVIDDDLTSGFRSNPIIII